MVPIDLTRNTSARGNQQIRRNMEMFAQTLHHRHAQFALAGHDLTDATRSAQKRHKISARQTMLLHQIGEQIGQRRRFARPARAFIRLDKAGLSYHVQMGALRALLEGSSADGLAEIVRSMCEDFCGMRDGFPDLMHVRDGKVSTHGGLKNGAHFRFRCAGRVARSAESQETLGL
jgi:hypothetical protein